MDFAMRDDENPTFIDLLESELDRLETLQEDDSTIDDLCLLELDWEEQEELRVDEGLTGEEFDDLIEATQRRVTSTGNVSRVATRKRRQQRARQTTGMSRSERQRRAKRSARTRKRNPAATRRAVRKRSRAMRKRRQMGI